MFNLAVEGNIGAGKSTFLGYLNEKFPDRIRIFQEPVNKWRNVNSVNLFDLMYKDPKRWGFAFQSYVQLTMLEMHDEISKNIESSSSDVDKKKRKSNQDRVFCNKKQKNFEKENKLTEINDVLKTLNEDNKQNENDYIINVMERSIFSSRYIFIENLFKNKMLTDIEYKILDDTFRFLIRKQDIKLDLVIYLRSTPQECYNRMLKRSRPEETQTLQIEDLEKFHLLHENFLGDNGFLRKILNVPILVIDTKDSKEKMFQAIDFHTKFLMNNLKREFLSEINDYTRKIYQL